MMSHMKFIPPNVLYTVEIAYGGRRIGQVIEVAGERYLNLPRTDDHLMLKVMGWGVDAEAIRLLRGEVSEIHVQVIRHATPEMSLYAVPYDKFAALPAKDEGQHPQLFLPLRDWSYERRQYIVPAWGKRVRRTSKWSEIINLEKKRSG